MQSAFHTWLFYLPNMRDLYNKRMWDLLYHHTQFLIRLIWEYLPNSAAETYPIYLISDLVLSVLPLVVCFWWKQWPVNWPIQQQAIFVVRTALEMLDMSKAIGDSAADSASLINQSTNHHFTTWAAQQYQAKPWYPLDHWCWNCWIVTHLVLSPSWPLM